MNKEYAVDNYDGMEDEYRMDLLDNDADRWEEEQDAYFEPDDCPLDGDAETALTSIGWGMDEDYLPFSDEPPFQDW